jgi:predicted transcriptional regulator
MMRKKKAARNAARASKHSTRYRNSDFLKKLGRHVRNVRLAQGYSIDRLYLESANVSRATISHLERGLIDPQISTLKRLADALNISLLELLRYE